MVVSDPRLPSGGARALRVRHPRIREHPDRLDRSDQDPNGTRTEEWREPTRRTPVGFPLTRSGPRPRVPRVSLIKLWSKCCLQDTMFAYGCWIANNRPLFREPTMKYEPKNFDRLLGTQGFSDTLLNNHFTLYKGYVTNTNKAAEILDTLLKEGKLATPEYAELSRRFGWEFNGMRLHEYYFDNMVKGGARLDAGSSLTTLIAREFGSHETWEKDFRGTGAMRGIGWTALYYDAHGDHLFNVWINEHDTGHLSGCAPLLIMDVFEHAFITDYQLKRADYIEAFFKAINWTTVGSRFKAAAK